MEPRFILHASVAHGGRAAALVTDLRGSRRRHLALGADAAGENENFLKKFRRAMPNRLIDIEISLS
jgi:hypothetical protein